MPSPNAVFTELVSTTFRNHRSDVIDNVSNHNAFLQRLMKKGMKRLEGGGTSIVQPLEYAENSTYQRYSGYDTLNIGASDVLTAADFPWRNVAIHITASGDELRQNASKQKIINLVKQRMKNAIRTFKNNFSFDVYGDGTLPKQIGGLQMLIADNGQGTVGGINAATWTFWRNKVQSAAAPMQGGGAITPSGATGVMESLMLPLWISQTRGDDKPDLILSSNEYFMFYETSQVSIKRYTQSDTARGGFQSLKYKSADVIFDGSSGIPAAHMYFLNTDYIHLVVHEDADLQERPEMRPYNQDAVLVPIIWSGNLTIGNRALQGVLKA